MAARVTSYCFSGSAFARAAATWPGVGSARTTTRKGACTMACMAPRAGALGHPGSTGGKVQFLRVLEAVHLHLQALARQPQAVRPDAGQGGGLRHLVGHPVGPQQGGQSVQADGGRLRAGGSRAPRSVAPPQRSPARSTLSFAQPSRPNIARGSPRCRGNGGAMPKRGPGIRRAGLRVCLCSCSFSYSYSCSAVAVGCASGSERLKGERLRGGRPKGRARVRVRAR